jgi:hypothetical protein
MSITQSITDARASGQRVEGAIANAAARTGIDFNYLLNQAKIESGLNPAARARTSSASGLYQFTRQSWLATVKQHGADHALGWAADAITQESSGRYTVTDTDQRAAILGLRDQPEAASAMAAEFASDNEAYLGQKLDRAVEPVDLYLAHFLGSAGAARFLAAHAANPSSPAAPILPAAATANRSVFYNLDGSARSLDDIRTSFAAKLGQSVGASITSPYEVGQSIISSRHASLSTTNGLSALKLRPIESMPTRLSLDFARRAYDRLSALDAGFNARLRT